MVIGSHRVLDQLFLPYHSNSKKMLGSKFRLIKTHLSKHGLSLKKYTTRPISNASLFSVNQIVHFYVSEKQHKKSRKASSSFYISKHLFDCDYIKNFTVLMRY